MSLNSCRLCLNTNNLGPLFVNNDVNRELDLSNITGLNIKYNDGFPQKICTECSILLESAIKLRTQSISTENRLLNLGYRKINENIFIKEIINDSLELNDKSDKEQDENEFTDSIETGAAIGQVPKVENRNGKRKKEYLDLVDGVLSPKGPVKCRICKKTVSNWPSFLSHAKLHVGLKIMCEFCGKILLSRYQLQRHCRSHHGMEKKMKCEYCSYMALDKQQLVLHERRVHTGERPYSCDVCSSAFHSRRCLAQHLDMHQAAGIQCPQCPQLVKSRRHLARHKYAAHSAATPRGAAACPRCARVYSRRYLPTHIATHT